MKHLLVVFRDLNTIASASRMIGHDVDTILPHVAAITNIAEGHMRYALVIALPDGESPPMLPWMMLPSAVFSFVGNNAFWASHADFVSDWKTQRTMAREIGLSEKIVEENFPEQTPQSATLLRYVPGDLIGNSKRVFQLCACELERKARIPYVLASPTINKELEPE